ncbi:hypothetical protein [Flavobacterium branchiophilum]|uniref:Uncharacterized protein n=1 Tax=Flavobacterium branchiophilum (strain FL-15) TaxID=1034807 RepID=G2Z274_FLABF|nr:hypothetical protein [Flavobacterium branchiophilum]CCB70029.1 Hypothetical protein FBFL15_1986 [Flavobacterium branchiophilum FL-15]
MDNLYNFLLIIIFMCIGLYFLYTTYKKPAPYYSTDIKGYVAGILFVMMALLSLFGKFSILEAIQGLFNK